MLLRNVTIAALVLSFAAPAAAQKPKLVVMKLVAERGIDDSLVRLLNELLLAEFSGMGEYEVLGESDVSALLTHESRKQVLACENATCMAEIGGALGANFLLSSNIGKIGIPTCSTSSSSTWNRRGCSGASASQSKASKKL